ncbi:hypothetical protein EMIHUDRAFT_313977 [Emiliania huxleyi CCMP1516]|uniref:PUB domain-containing protein n=2 Tax=Emiliania huxleyi TaxID=2903 RepID=A0A0D3KCV3_EMIH1|nr:hypothetical protein EMIHUDRAFT_313977 [Emiliania huxleyi CCMP1516]EOD33588.1 hypothetical protein EMIHUDRAFT_313977 [Emiliania huxleyi CCMP1516]|eukprot:XP_005786017.1 hypothetical protein EMIHUDRAFT_313977 [Emiliania huxleyi CCMP1516]
MSADALPYCPPSTAPDPLETEVAQARKLVLRALDAKIAIQDDATALGAIRLALKLAGNILEHPDEGKYTRIKNSSAAFQRCLAKCPGGLELVMAMGFRTVVHEFEEFWAVEVSPLALSILAAAREGLARYESLVAGGEGAASAAREGDGEQRAAGPGVLADIEADKAERRERAALMRRDVDASPPPRGGAANGEAGREGLEGKEAQAEAEAEAHDQDAEGNGDDAPALDPALEGSEECARRSEAA